MTDDSSKQWWEQKQNASADTALSNVPLAGNLYKEFKDSYSLAEKASQGDGAAAGQAVTNIASDAAGFAADAVSAAIDPLNFLISKGLGFLENVLFPLKDILQVVTGDPKKLEECAEKFDAIAKSLNDLAVTFEQTVLPGTADWSGDAAAAAGHSIGETKQGILSTAQAAGNIASLLQISSMLMQAAYDIINGIIADVVEWLVVTWVAAQVTAPVTFGASEAGAAAATAGEVAEGAAQATEKVEQVSSIMTKIVNVLKKLKTRFLQDEMKDEATGVITQVESKAHKAIGKSFSKMLSESVEKRALGAVGVPTKKSMKYKEYANDLDDLNQTVGYLKTGADSAKKIFQLGTGFGKAAEYSVDPGGQSEEKDDGQSQGAKGSGS